MHLKCAYLNMYLLQLNILQPKRIVIIQLIWVTEGMGSSLTGSTGGFASPPPNVNLNLLQTFTAVLQITSFNVDQLLLERRVPYIVTSVVNVCLATFLWCFLPMNVWLSSPLQCPSPNLPTSDEDGPSSGITKRAEVLIILQISNVSRMLSMLQIVPLGHSGPHYGNTSSRVDDILIKTLSPLFERFLLKDLIRFSKINRKQTKIPK